MPLNTKQRASQEEFLDDFSLEGDLLRDALDKIAAINQWLGGNQVTLDGIKKLLVNVPRQRAVSIVDIGCGNGDLCRAIADFGKDTGMRITILGIDANDYTIGHAKKLSITYPTVSYAVMNVFDDAFARLEYDIALCTLTLHHFADEQILALMRLLTNRAKLGVVINDLHRSALAYRLFQLICFVFRLNKLSKDDGLLSILRGFKKRDLEAFSRQLQLVSYQINWRWAFRYQWIIQNVCV